jgi:hypothetical protein
MNLGHSNITIFLLSSLIKTSEFYVNSGVLINQHDVHDLSLIKKSFVLKKYHVE